MKQFLLLTLLATSLAAMGCNGGAEGSLGNDDIGDEGAAGDDDTSQPVNCEDQWIEALEWFEASGEAQLSGNIELAQTHIVLPDDSRRAPRPSQGRETLLLFSPDETVSADTDLRVGAFDGDVLLGVIAARTPDELPPYLETALTTESLAPYSTSAWSAFLPWAWLRPGVTLRIGTLSGDTLLAYDHDLADLAPPHRFTISRSKMVLFGEDDFPTDTEPASRIARDFFASAPAAELRWVDSLPWRLDSIVIRTDDGPQLVHSEDERLDITPDPDHWSILKHQLALRLSLANTGRGLAMTGESEGDSSPYSFGTSVGMGWFRDNTGSYLDIDDAPWAAGWTGWTAMWLGECGNGFIHEVGHSFTLEHFNEGTAEGWGIADEYPQDGTNLQTHPAGYDSTRRQLRTWYRVDAWGPVMADDGTWVGKRDPMNGGESPNDVTCFPQYTAYQAEKAQNWSEATRTIANHDEVPGIYLWNTESQAYEASEPDVGHETPVAVDVPVTTLIGTLGNNDEACQTYPAMFAPSGNAFTLPDPEAEDLPDVFEGATWFLEIAYTDGTSDRALIAREPIVDTALSLYSLNLESEREPTRVDLYQSPVGYPEIDVGAATLVHSRSITLPTGALPKVLQVGKGHLANDALTLTDRCEPEVSCLSRERESTWRVSGEALYFQDSKGDVPAAASCLEQGEVTTLSVPVSNEDGETFSVVVHGQRVMSSASHEVIVPLHDNTPWIDAPDLNQSLRLWLPQEPNAGLPTGRYRSDDGYELQGWLGDELFSETPVHIDLSVLETTEVDLASEFLSEGLTTPDSSMYFLVRGPGIGPTERVWWDDGQDGPVVLNVPMLDEVSGQLVTLKVDAQQEACGARWDFHAGQGAGNCSHHAVLNVSDTGNEDLVAGRTYRSPASMPLVIEGRRWHDPDARALIGVWALDLRYTVPD